MYCNPRISILYEFLITFIYIFNRESGVIEDDNISGEYDLAEGGKVRKKI